MKKILFLSLLLFHLFSYGQEERLLFGTITDGKNPIENVKIKVDGEKTMTTSDKDGKYKIKVEKGDYVIYSYVGLNTVKIKIEDVTRILNPILVPKITELDEVTLKASRRLSQKDLEEDYYINENIIKTAFGYTDTRRIATNIDILTKDRILPINTCILDLLQNEFAGVQVFGSCLQNNGGILIRGANSINNNAFAIYDVDGLIFTDVPFFIDPQVIERIAIIRGLSGTVRYGTLGLGGVVVINTSLDAPGVKSNIDRAQLKKNYLKEKVLTSAEVERNNANYLKELHASGTLAMAKTVFEKYDTQYSSNPYFYLDAYNYFYDKKNDKDYADTIIEENFALFETNAVLLKALAYMYQEQGRFQKANEILKEVFILRPNYLQSYMDMANSYRDINKNRQAASLYARYDYLLEEGFIKQDTLDFEPIIGRDINNLLLLNKKDVVEVKNVKKLFVEEESYEGTRLVFEWNDGEADFDLQFVNPEGQYYTWKHNLLDKPEVIAREKDFGYNVKEYLVDGSLQGTWKINVNYSGNKSLTPTYLKATIYSNYATPQQRKEVKVFKLSLKNANYELFSLQSHSNFVTK